MKMIIALLVICIISALTVAKPAEDKYTTKYDSFDVDGVLTNRRLLINYINCCLDRGKCTKEGTELKNHIADALSTDCAKCSEKQKEVGKKVLKHVFEKEKDYFKELEAKYDPDGIYRKKYAEDAKKEGIDIEEKN